MNLTLRIVLYCLAIVILLFGSAFFSSADMTYSVAPINRLEKEKGKRRSSALAYEHATHYDKTIVTLLFGNNLVNILASSIMTVLTQVVWPESPIATTLGSFVLLLLLLTFGEILPKVIGKTYNYSLARAFAYPVRVFQIIFFPFVFVFSRFASWMVTPVYRIAERHDAPPSDDELQAMVEAIEEEGIIDEDQSELLSRSIEFKDTTAHDIMTPRVRIEGIEAMTNLNRYVKTENAFLHSRIPVYEKDYDHIIGYIPVKALLKKMLTVKNLSIKDLMLPVISVPQTMEISSVLRLMKRSHHHIAVVRDEFGGTDGIITLEDILEELVGELYDENEVVKEDVVKTEKRNRFLVRGAMDIYAFFERFGLDEEEIDEDYNTVSGWVNDHLGRFARSGDKFSYDKVDVVIKKATKYTVIEAEVAYHPRRKKKE